MQFLDCKITLSFSNQKIKDRSETLINKGIYEVKLKFITSLIKAFNDFDSLSERLYAKQMMQIMFRGNDAWEQAYKEMKAAGYFKEEAPQFILINPQFGSLYEIKGNKEVNIGKGYNGEEYNDEE